MRERFLILVVMLLTAVLCDAVGAEERACGVAVPAAGNPAARLWVDGTSIVDGNGQPVQLRGIYSRTSWLESEQQVRQFKHWGVNFVRLLLAFDKDYWETVNDGAVDLDKRCILRQQNLLQTDERLRWLESAGIHYIIEIHWRALGLNDELEKPELLAQQFAGFYRQVAQRYRNLDYLIGYCTFSEIYVKPELYDEYNMIRTAIVDAIREVDPRRIVSVTGVQTSAPGSIIDAIHIDRPGLIYDFHYYHPKMFTHYRSYYGDLRYPGYVADGYGDGVALVDRGYLQEKLQPALDFARKWNVPIWCGEFGAFGDAPDNSSRRWERDFAEILDEEGIPWIFWTWKKGRTAVPQLWKQLWRDEASRAHVTIVPHGGPMVGSVQVQLQTQMENVAIHYTLNGREPQASSPVYDAPLTLTGSTTVRARGFVAGKAATPTDVASFYALRMQTPVTVEKPKQGLRYRYSEITADELPSLTTAPAVKQGVCRTVDLQMAQRPNEIAVIYEGFLDVKADGLYYFYSSDAGQSRLFIGDEVVVNNPVSRWLNRRTGYAALRAGLHPFRIEYGRADVAEVYYPAHRRGEFLLVEYEGPGVKRQPIPADVLYHAAGP